jgi:hypothetical protein
MAGAMHEAAKSAFARMFKEKLNSLRVLRSLFPTGSTRFARPGGRSKEADGGYIPPSRRVEDDWPSFVIEVGVSKSRAKLRRDYRTECIERLYNMYV